MPTVYVNDKPVEIGNQRLNCVQAAELATTEIPHYCYHPALSIVASCRMCLVEVGEMKDGKVTMQPKVLPGCQTPVKDGMVIVTGDYHTKRDKATPVLPYDANYKPGDRAKKSQADTLEGLLLNHPLDCPVCDKAGECKLQDYSYTFGRSESRMIDIKNTPANKPGLSSKITLFTDRCIMCTRCVRFTREIAGTGELFVNGRGHHEEIDVFPGRPLENKLSGNVVDLCPVGALGSKDFLYTQRVWYLKTTNGVCSGCSTGCSIHVDTNKDIVYRLRPRTNPEAQGYFMCDEGRWGYHYANSPDRFSKPLAKKDGKFYHTPYQELFAPMKADLLAAVKNDPAGLAVVLSPNLTLEEAYLWASTAKSWNLAVRLVMGPVPVVGADDTYPKDVKGNPVTPVKFTIHAEKAPNRAGVEMILKHFQGEVIPFSQLGNPSAVIFLGGYPKVAIIEAELAAAKLPELVICQDLFTSPIAKAAKYILPGTTSFEKDGTFVNQANLAQSFPRNVNPPKEARSELQVAYDLAGKKGFVQPAQIRQELAKTFPALAHLADVSTTPAGKRLELQTV
ncbi:MAG: molybdopterin-dependent oxidoreductase [Fimbriiglobus sp.]